jgi:CP family cyanate transporter-like MFS transporter
VSSPTARRAGIGLAIGLVAIGINLRPAVASVGPVLDDLKRSLHLSDAEASAVTSLPVVCFGVFAPVGAWLSRRVGLRRAVAILALVLVAGMFVRLGPNVFTFVVGTLIAAAGIAALNVVTPALVKLDFPTRTGLMMGVYTTALTGAAAAAAGLTVPAEHSIGHGWRGGLAVWAVLAVVGLVIWLPQATGSGEPPLDQPHIGALLRDRVAWLVTAYFGLQSLGFYAVLTWLPTLFTDHGYSASRAGALLSVSALVQAPVALITPTLAARSRQQGPWVLFSTALTAAGLLGLLLAPTAAPWLWVVILGMGQGSSFPLSLTIMVMRSPTPDATTALSSMAQTIGYLVAALGPLLVGILHSATGGWTAPLLLLLVLLVPLAITGVAAGRPRQLQA